jgi:glycosyltransferase 2 family protein
MSHPTDTPPVAGGTFEKLFRTALIVIPIGVLGNILFSFWATDRAILASLLAFPRRYLAIAVGLALLPWLMNTLRLYIWTRFFGYGLSFRDAYQVTLAMDLGAAVSPTAVGGGFFRWGLLVQRGVSPGAAASLTTLPALEDGLFFLVALPIAIYLSAAWNLPVFDRLAPELRDGLLLLGPLLVGSLLVAWISARLVLSGGLGQRFRERGLRLFGRLRRRLRNAWDDGREIFRIILRNGKGWFVLSMACTSVHWMARYSVIAAFAAFLGAPVDPVLFWLLQWVVFSLMSLIPTPGAVGGAEASFYLIYGAVLPDGVLGIATAGWRFLTFYLQLGLAAILFTLMNMQRPWSSATATPPAAIEITADEREHRQHSG